MWELDYKESWSLKNWCFWTVVLEKTLENPLDCKEIQPAHPKGDQSWVFIGRTDAVAEINSSTLATWCEELTHLKRPWCWERLKAGGEGNDREWDGWMASPTQWTCVWASSSSWLWTGKPGMLQFMGSQGVRHDWATNLNWTESNTETGSGFPPICQVDYLTILKRCNVFWGCFHAQHESRSALINNYCYAQRWRGWLHRWSLFTILDYQKGTGL